MGIDSSAMFLDFRDPTNLAQLSRYIGISEADLKLVTGPNKKIYFIPHHIPKKNFRNSNAYRLVWEARSNLADCYKSFARRFDIFARRVNNRYPHPCAYGYTRGRGTIDNAKGHCAAPNILHADIKDFFPSISDKKIKNLFLSMNINEKVATILTKFLTIDRSLPLGLHPSPMLANLVCLNLDNSFEELARQFKCTYTRYADDITISGHKIPGKKEIEEILKEDGFHLSEKKFRTTKIGQSHYVTGLSVSDKSPRAPRIMKRRLRQELYYCKKYGVKKHIEYLYPLFNEMIEKHGEGRKLCDIVDNSFYQPDINRIDGTIRYVSHIEPQIYSHIRREWADLLKSENLKVAYRNQKSRQRRQFNFFIDESEFDYKGRKIIALSFVQVEREDIDKINSFIENTRESYIRDPFVGGNKNQIEKKGLHHCDSNEDLRKIYTDQLINFPYKSYLVYSSLGCPEDYREKYLELIRKILPHRLMWCAGAEVTMIFEENSKISLADFKKTVTSVYELLKNSKNRCPAELQIAIGKKAEHPCLSMPDFLLGTFSRYAKLEKGSTAERPMLFFEKLRDKYRVILDADSNIPYTRKRPFIPWESFS